MGLGSGFEVGWDAVGLDFQFEWDAWAWSCADEACLFPVLKQVHPDTGISNKAMAILNSFVNDIFERIATEASSTYYLVLLQ